MYMHALLSNLIMSQMNK